MEQASVPLLDCTLQIDDHEIFPSSELNTRISNHIRVKIHGFLKWFGFRSSPIAIICIVMAEMMINTVVNALTFNHSQYCLYLNVCVLLFQAESVILYGFAFCSVTKEFIDKVVSQLSQIDICSPVYQQVVDNIGGRKVRKRSSLEIYEEYKSHQSFEHSGARIVMNEALKCLLVVIPSYLSGYLIWFVPFGGDNIWEVYVYFSNVLDIIRYAPVILHIALVRSYFQTFPIQLQQIRDRIGVIKRKDELYDSDYELGKHKLSITHADFVELCETVIRPYRRLSSQLSAWILIYFVCNAATFTLFLLSVISTLMNGDCQYSQIGIYYIHYLIELWTFFAEWGFLVLPYCTNESLLNAFFNDVKTMANISAIEKCAIDRYIDSYDDKSPFSIYSIKPSYKKLLNLLHIVMITITLDIVSKVYDINII
eukprot:219865_1